MEAILTRKDFYFGEHITHDNRGYTSFKNGRIHHRFGHKPVTEGVFQLRPQSHGNPCRVISLFDTWIRALNYSLTDKRSFSYSTSILEFNSIETANKTVDNIFEVIENNPGFITISDYILSTKSKLPKGIIGARDTEKKFKFFKVDVNDNFKITLYDFEKDYLKNHKSIDDLYHYDFSTMTVIENLECKTWVRN